MPNEQYWLTREPNSGGAGGGGRGGGRGGAAEVVMTVQQDASSLTVTNPQGVVQKYTLDSKPFNKTLDTGMAKAVVTAGIQGETAKIKNLRQAERYLPDNIYTAIDNFKKADWTTKLFGEDVKARYADLKQASADRCPRLLGTFVKAPEVQYHHDVYNQFLWNLF